MSDARREVESEACGCPCAHAAPIEARAGVIVCTIGKEKLCPACVTTSDGGDSYHCHEGHDD